MNNRWSTKMLVEAGIMIGLATALSYLKIMKLPQGGSVTMGSMIPIIIFALRYGLKPGLLAGLVYSAVQFMVEPFVVHPVQFLLDYPLAFGFLGLSGLMHKAYKQGSMLAAIAGGYIAIGARFLMHFLSGVVFFGEYAKEAGMSAIVYSAIYNGSYLGVELLITLVALAILVKPLSKIA